MMKEGVQKQLQKIELTTAVRWMNQRKPFEEGHFRWF